MKNNHVIGWWLLDPIKKKVEKQIGDTISCIIQPHLKDTFGPQDLLANLPYGAETLNRITAVTKPKANHGIKIFEYISLSINEY